MGGGEPQDRFIPSLIHRMLPGETVDVTIGTQHRDIIAAEDVLHAMDLIIHSNLLGYHEIPVGTGEAPAIAELVDYIWHETGEKSIINYGAIPMRPNEPDCVADTTILSTLGTWQPIDWKTGIKAMIDDIKKIKKKENE